MSEQRGNSADLCPWFFMGPISDKLCVFCGQTALFFSARSKTTAARPLWSFLALQKSKPKRFRTYYFLASVLVWVLDEMDSLLVGWQDGKIHRLTFSSSGTVAIVRHNQSAVQPPLCQKGQKEGPSHAPQQEHLDSCSSSTATLRCWSTTMTQAQTILLDGGRDTQIKSYLDI